MRKWLFLVLFLLASAGAQEARVKLWLVNESEMVLTPQTVRLEPAARPDMRGFIESPVTTWLEGALRSIEGSKIPPVHAARALTLLSVAINDALACAVTLRAQGVNLDDAVIVATVASYILSYALPAFAVGSVAQAEGVIQAQLLELPLETVTGSYSLGTAVAHEVLAFARRDGANLAAAYRLPDAAPGVWQPTAPGFLAAYEPDWGTLRTIGEPDLSRFVLAAPPAWDSEAFEAERALFLRYQQNLTDDERDLARYWAADPGTFTPSGMWFRTARDLILQHDMGNLEAAHLLATLGVGIHTSFIKAWEVKYEHNLARPIQWMHERDPDWRPVVVTPPFPAYPSGHATVSGTAATILAGFFPDEAATFQRMAQDASLSRVVGGIHWMIDGTAGLELGQQVGLWALEASGH